MLRKDLLTSARTRMLKTTLFPRFAFLAEQPVAMLLALIVVSILPGSADSLLGDDGVTEAAKGLWFADVSHDSIDAKSFEPTEQLIT
jgi:hypothetical protein